MYKNIEGKTLIKEIRVKMKRGDTLGSYLALRIANREQKRSAGKKSQTGKREWADPFGISRSTY